MTRSAISARPALRPEGYQIGALVTLTGTVILSTGALWVKYVDTATGWQIIFYRSIGLFFGLWVLFCLRHGRTALERLKQTWKPALAAGPFQGAASIFFIMSLTQTTAANAMLPMSSVPVISAVLGWFFLREHLRSATVLALLGAATGVCIMTAGGISEGNAGGSLLAIANAVAFASYLVLLRRTSRTGADMTPAVILGSLVAGTVSLLLMPSFAISLHDLLICLGWGSVVQCTGVACVIFGSRYLRAAELSLLVIVESTTGPVFVWLFLGEVPGFWSIVGGAIVLSVVALWSADQIRRERAMRPRAAAIPPTL